MFAAGLLGIATPTAASERTDAAKGPRRRAEEQHDEIERDEPEPTERSRRLGSDRAVRKGKPSSVIGVGLIVLLLHAAALYLLLLALAVALHAVNLAVVRLIAAGLVRLIGALRLAVGAATLWAIGLLACPSNRTACHDLLFDPAMPACPRLRLGVRP